jgi:hypothetical protein
VVASGFELESFCGMPLAGFSLVVFDCDAGWVEEGAAAGAAAGEDAGAEEFDGANSKSPAPFFNRAISTRPPPETRRVLPSYVFSGALPMPTGKMR